MCGIVAVIGAPMFAPVQLEGALSLFERLKSDSPWSNVVEADTAFHKALIDEIGSPRLSALYSTLLTEFRLCILHSPIPDDYPGSVIGKHQLLVESLKHGNPEEAVECFRFHLEDSKRLLIARYTALAARDGNSLTSHSNAPLLPAEPL